MPRSPLCELIKPGSEQRPAAKHRRQIDRQQTNPPHRQAIIKPFPNAAKHKLEWYCVSDEGEKGRAGSPLPAAARTECAPYQPRLRRCLEGECALATERQKEYQ